MNIYIRQNEKCSLELLKIQRKIYLKAKKIQTIYNVCAILVSIVFLVLPTIIQSVILWNFSIFIAALVFLSNWIVDLYLSKEKELAAGIQQCFDSYVLGVPVNYLGLKSLNSEQITKLKTKYKNHVVKNLENWYSDYSGFEGERQIIFCQKENVRWDKPLRTKLFWLVVVFLIIIIISIITVGIILDDLHLIFCVLSWIVPFFNLGFSIARSLHKDIKRLETLENELKGIELIDINEIKNKVVEIQRLIWEHRKKCYLIPEFFYNIYREKQQDEEDALAKEYKHKLDSRGKKDILPK